MVSAGEKPPLLPDPARRPDARHGTGPRLRHDGFLTGEGLKRRIVALAEAEGFDAVRFTVPAAIPDAEARLARMA